MTGVGPSHFWVQWFSGLAAYRDGDQGASWNVFEDETQAVCSRYVDRFIEVHKLRTSNGERLDVDGYDELSVIVTHIGMAGKRKVTKTFSI